ncbi:MlaD family protein [Segniliparus rugosus]|uniref:Virulence factor Mce family protein n=1 Tax=Segniliparus rugosus (strain ATCC BAA-974 / DSM 45345 / CCUG 50838 / CIP 108380 / JCM 13579 / CDC 945) TaxID=679197 RepID=E5XTQ9_SEGRC|nr:MCE family protein [Segniliparus rugosus]EFV12262.1 virulence factor Mce family protein [Segniliparus rugosus ATCC BAA-974]
MAVVVVFTAIAGVFAAIVMNALRSPVTGATVRYTATFTDVAGLFVGNDVRIAGVQVGKVETVQLNGHQADVGFSLLKTQQVYKDTIVAVRYQNLLGQRYLELVQPHTPGAPMAPGSTVPVERTIPSFDISKLFNGFRPLFQTLDPAQFNQFGEDVLRLIQGNGEDSALGPVLHDLDVISKVAVDRESVFVRFIQNLGAVSDELSGKSKQTVDVIRTLNEMLDVWTSDAGMVSNVIDDVNYILTEIHPLLTYVEGGLDSMTIPYYDFAMRVLPHTPAIVGSLLTVPSLMQGLRDETLDGPAKAPNFTCSNGVADLPGVGEVFFGDQNLVLCQ